MKEVFNKSKEDLLSKEFCQKIAKSFSCSAGRAGKPVVKWTEVQSWFQSRQQDKPSKVASSTNESKKVSNLPVACPPIKQHGSSQEPRGEKVPDVSEMEFEARSSKDGAWYDVEKFMAHRLLDSEEAEVRVRLVGFGAKDDEWVNVKKSLREQSVPLEHSDCHKLKVGDHVLCFQERRDQAIHYDAHIVEIQGRMLDIRAAGACFQFNIIMTTARQILSFTFFSTLLSGESSFEEIMLQANILDLGSNAQNKMRIYSSYFCLLYE